MDLAEAMRKKLEASLAGSDWTLWQAAPDPSSVRFWLYSMSLVRGPRIGCQLTSEAYRDMSNGTGVFKEIDDAGIPGNQLLASVVGQFDAEHDLLKRRELGDYFATALAAYARITKTWSLIPPLSSIPGVHFIAVDWVTLAGLVIIRPMAFFDDGIPDTSVFIEGAHRQLEMHLANYPDEWPVEFDS